MDIDETKQEQGAKAADPFWVAISMYSILPAPHKEWHKGSMSAAICFLPIIGILVGGVLALWQLLCLTINIAPVIFASVATVIPIIITGGLHMDGFMDTADAIGSHRSREERLEIMKDSHAGAFAVLWCAIYLLLSFGVYWVLYETSAFWMIGIIYIMSRSLCTLSSLTLPSARSGGLLHAFTEHAKNRVAIVIMIVVFIICVAGLVVLDPWTGLCCAVLAIAVFFIYRGVTLKLFGGATGDTSGFFIQICELCLLYGAMIGSSL